MRNILFFLIALSVVAVCLGGLRSAQTDEGEAPSHPVALTLDLAVGAHLQDATRVLPGWGAEGSNIVESLAITVGAEKAEVKASSLFDKEEMTLLHTTASELVGIENVPFRKRLRDEVVSRFREQGGVELAVRVLSNPNLVIELFPEDQAFVRVLAIEVLGQLAQTDLSVPLQTLRTVSKYLADNHPSNASIEYDYRDLLYIYLDNTSPDDVLNIGIEIQEIIGANDFTAPLARKYVLQYYNLQLDDDKVYKILRNIKEVP